MFFLIISGRMNDFMGNEIYLQITLTECLAGEVRDHNFKV